MQGQPNNLGSYQRQALFQEHKHSLRIAEAILHVFVSIEETRQVVEFEQKFSYSAPCMMGVMEMLTSSIQQFLPTPPSS